jgi:large subunit ribosomal protein L10
MARQDKAIAVDELTREFTESNAAVLTEYRGLTVAQLKELRRNLGDKASYLVVKNTLTKIAAERAGVRQSDGTRTEGTHAGGFQGAPGDKRAAGIIIIAGEDCGAGPLLNKCAGINQIRYRG